MIDVEASAQGEPLETMWRSHTEHSCIQNLLAVQ